MHRLHLARNFRSLVFLLLVAALLSAVGIVAWANYTGMPESWRAAIERAISQQGAHIKIAGLQYRPLQGVIASKVQVFSDASHTHQISSLESVILDFDKTKLARGIVHITKIQLKDADLTLPVDPDDPHSESLQVSHANGTLFMPGSRRLEIRNAYGLIANVDVSLNARLIGYQQEGENPSSADQRGRRRELLARVIHELNQWHFDAKSPPKICVSLDGDANQSSSLVAKVTLQAQQIEKNQHSLDEVAIAAEISGDLLTVNSLTAKDSSGTLRGSIDYDIGDRNGRFDLHSSLEIPALLQAWLSLPPLKGILINGAQTLDAVGKFQIPPQESPKIQMTGQAHCESVTLRGVHFSSIQSNFSWRDGDLFLRDARLTHPDGEVNGKAMIQWPQVRLALDSTLPEQLLKPFFIGQPLEIVIGDFQDREGAKIHVFLEGGFDATDNHSWAYSGGGRVTNVNYKGVPVNSAECRFSLSHHELDFFDGTVVFNYKNYPLRKAYNGPAEGTAKVGRIRYVAENKTVEVEDVTGAIWAAPMVRLFAPKVADSLEVYRFHTPPQLSGSGIVDVTPQGRTALDVSFSSNGAADYTFLGENLTLFQPRANVAIRGERVQINDLKLNAFDGPVTANFDFQKDGKLEGNIHWTQLALPALASTYGFQIKGGGNLTGRMDFSISHGNVETMNGEGLFAVENTELFSVPMFGPLSSIIGGVLGDKRVGFERAKSAFCNFKILNGLLTSRDFSTSTKSLTFAGDGSVDLKERTLDMTMRMNARGLLGLITLPLRPFYGMFQFRGTGPLKNPQWENVMFTTPPPEQGELLQPAPKAKLLNNP